RGIPARWCLAEEAVPRGGATRRPHARARILDREELVVSGGPGPPREQRAAMDEHSLQLLEFQRVTEAVAGRAACDAARAALAASRPIADRGRRDAECALLAEAIARVAAPDEWCFTGRGVLAERIEGRNAAEALDGPGLV